MKESIENDRRCIFTELNEKNTISISHTAGTEAKVRFLVVFKNPSEIMTPVHPCKNHLNETHPGRASFFLFSYEFRALVNLLCGMLRI